MNKQIKLGTITSYIQIAFNMLFAMFFTPLLIKTLGNSDYAIYSLLYTFLSYFVMDFGIGSSLAKFFTDCKYKKNNKYKEEEVLAASYKIFALLSIVLAIAFLVAYNYLDLYFTGLKPSEMSNLKSSYILAIIYAVIGFLFTPNEAVFTANELFAQSKIMKMAQKIIFSVLAYIFAVTGKGLIWIVGASTFSGILYTCIQLVYLSRNNLLRINWKFWDNELFLDIFKYSVWVQIGGIASKFIIPFAPTILGRYADSNQIALFSIASTLEGYVYTFGDALNSLLFPKTSKLTNENKYDELNAFQVKIGKIQCFFISLIVFGFVVFGKEFLYLWVGNGYEEAYYIFLLITVSEIISIAMQISNNALQVVNKIKYQSISTAIGAIVCVVLSINLSKTHGAIGAAIAIFVYRVLFGIIVNMYIYKKYTPISIKELVVNCYMKILPVIGIYTVVWYFLNKMISGSISMYALLIKIVLFIAILLPISYITMINNNERIYLKSLFKR